MRVLLVSEFVRRFPWSPTLWGADLAVALARRGHAVTAACDGVEEPGVFSGVRLLVRDDRRTVRRFSPLAFQRWARELVASGEFDATISLSPLVPAGLWIAGAPGALALVRTLVGAHNPVSAALEVVSRPWLPLALAAEVRARAVAPGAGRGRARLGTLSAEPGVVPLGYASRLAPPSPADRAGLRARVRELLGIAPDRPVLLVSCVHPGRPGLDAMLRGVANLRDAGPTRAPFLLVVGRRSHAMHEAGERAGCAGSMRFLGGTWRMDAALSAADLALAPWTDAGPLSTGRFVADALRMGCPILAHRRAPGAELVEPAHFGSPALGGVVGSSTAAAWREAIGAAMQTGELPGASRAARDVGGTLSLENLAMRVEGAVREVTK